VTEITDEDVTGGGRALHTAWVRMDEGLDLFGKDAHQYLARAVLAAVLPAHDKRVKVELLKELMVEPIHPLTHAWLVSVLEQIEGYVR